MADPGPTPVSKKYVIGKHNGVGCNLNKTVDKYSIVNMTTILASMENSLLIVDSTRDGWKIHESLKNCNQICIATDPQNTDRIIVDF